MFKRSVLIVALVAAVVFAGVYQISTTLTNPGESPRRLEVGDTWTYKVLFPDSKSYLLTESVLRIDSVNGTDAYVLFIDDPQHISTQYLWITPDWREIQTFTPRIGNLLANSTTIYTPPIQLFHLPFHVGDHWTVETVARTITLADHVTIDTKSPLLETRETASVDTVSTQVGQFRAFKVTVTINDSLSENLWFQPELGQTVYGEFYNDNEKVTQTLIAYKLNPAPALLNGTTFATPSLERQRFQENRGWKIFASYIYMGGANPLRGVEDIL